MFNKVTLIGMAIPVEFFWSKSSELVAVLTLDGEVPIGKQSRSTDRSYAASGRCCRQPCRVSAPATDRAEAPSH